MGKYLNPRLTVAQAGPALEQEMRWRFGDAAFEHYYRVFALQVSEQASDEEGQLVGVIALIGRTQDQATLFLSIIWLAKKRVQNLLVQEMLELVHQKTVRQLLQETRPVAQEA